MDGPLRPTFTLDDFFGSEIVYCQRISPTACTWLPFDDMRKDTMTGGALSITGDMPHICSAAVSTPAAMQLIKDAGLPVPGKDLLRYTDKEDYIRLLQVLSRTGKKVAAQYLHDESELPEANCWIQPSLISFVNNKANLKALVDDGYLPRRAIVPFAELTSYLSRYPLPNVVKAVTEEPTGAGLDVIICETAADVSRAEKVFGVCAFVVVEEFLHIARNLCLNYAVTSEGEIIFLGCAEQICTRNGVYLGNWLGKNIEAPPEAVSVGRQIVQKGFTLGYSGLVGIDMAVLADGRIMVFDLNFRINGSTTPLLLARSAMETYGQPLIKLDRFVGTSTYRDMLDIIYGQLGKGKFVPIASYDPESGGYPGSQPRLIAMLLGETKDEIDEYKSELERMGLAGTSYRKEIS
ncbi:MAG: ATP-grasp domain-containing protein [Geobacteraceae bacterium]|nr:ATP-grasp domain-containing protein [Geobacteraceae bacterium]